MSGTSDRQFERRHAYRGIIEGYKGRGMSDEFSHGYNL